MDGGKWRQNITSVASHPKSRTRSRALRCARARTRVCRLMADAHAQMQASRRIRVRTCAIRALPRVHACAQYAHSHACRRSACDANIRLSSACRSTQKDCNIACNLQPINKTGLTHHATEQCIRPHAPCSMQQAPYSHCATGGRRGEAASGAHEDLRQHSARLEVAVHCCAEQLVLLLCAKAVKRAGTA